MIPLLSLISLEWQIHFGTGRFEDTKLYRALRIITSALKLYPETDW